MRGQPRRLAVRRLEEEDWNSGQVVRRRDGRAANRGSPEFLQGRALDQGRAADRAHAVRRQQPRQGAGDLRRLRQEATAGAVDDQAANSCASTVARVTVGAPPCGAWRPTSPSCWTSFHNVGRGPLSAFLIIAAQLGEASRFVSVTTVMPAASNSSHATRVVHLRRYIQRDIMCCHERQSSRMWQ